MTAARKVLLVVMLFIPSLVQAGEDRLAGIGQLVMSGHTKEARALLVDERAACIAKSDVSGEAITLLLLGLADSSLNDAKSARASLRTAITKFADVHDSFASWFCLWILSELETAEGHSEEAVALHERQLAALREAAEPKAHFSPQAMMALATFFGMPADGSGPLASFPEILKPILLQFAAVVTHDGYGHTLVEMGELEKGEKQLDEAMASASLFGGLFDSSIAAHVGDLRRQQWRLDEARESYRKALAGLAVMPAGFLRDGSLEVQIVGRFADLELLSGHLDDALAWNDRALKLIRATGNKKRESSILEDRGTLLVNGGRSDEAATTFHEALKLAEDSADVFRQAAIHADLGALLFFRGSYESALRELEKSIELYQTLDQPYVEAPVWTLLAEVHMILGAQDNVMQDLDKARALAKKSGFKLAGAMVDMIAAAKRYTTGHGPMSEVDQALNAWWDMPEARGLMFSKEAQRTLSECLHLGSGPGSTTDPGLVTTPGPPLVLVTSLMLRGKMFLDRGEYEQARTFWQQALAMNPNRDQHFGLLGLIGATYWREGKADEAIRYFSQAADTLDASASDLKVEELLAGYLGSNRHWYYDLLIEMLLRQGRVDEAFAQAERARARAFLQLVGNHRFNAEGGGDPNLLAEAEAVRTRIAQLELEAPRALPEEAARINAELPGARQRYRSLMIRVKVSNPEYAALTNVEPLPIETVRQQLPADATLISYFVSANHVHAWVVDRLGVHYALLPLDAAGLRNIVCWVDRFVPQFDPRGVTAVRAGCNDRTTAEDAFALLIAPLRKYIAHGRLIIVPHGMLHYVPFAALRDSSTGHYLIEDYTLTYAPSASALRFLRAKETPMTGTALVLGDPETPLALTRLPGAGEEAIDVARRLGTSPHLGHEATEGLLDDLGGTVDIVHIAAHGFYDPVNPLFSRITLAADATHDGSLTVHEILSRLDLRGVNLIVLSACRSAIGARSSGDEVVGLTRALLFAGTPGVISTLWNVDDTASAELMDEFYLHFEEGASVAEALRQAQLSVMRSDTHGDPKYWAAFTLNGDPQACWTPH